MTTALTERTVGSMMATPRDRGASMDAAAHTTNGHTTTAPVRGCVSLCHEDACDVPGPLCVLTDFDRR